MTKNRYTKLSLVAAFQCLFLAHANVLHSDETEPNAEEYSGFGKESISPEVIKKYAPGPVDQQQLTVIERALDVRVPNGGILSADGKKLFFNWKISGSKQVWSLDQPKGFPIQLSGGSTGTTLESVTPDGKWLILTRDQDGEETPGIYLQSTNGGAITVIQHTPKTKADPQHISADSNYLYWTANDIESSSYAIYRSELPKRSGQPIGKKELLLDTPGLWSILDSDDKRELFLLSKHTGSESNEVYVWSLSERKLIPLIGQNQHHHYKVRFSEKPDEYWVFTHQLSNYGKLYRLKNGKLTEWGPFASQAPKESEPQKFEVDSFALDYPRRRIYLTYNKRGYLETEVYDARTSKKLSLPKFLKNQDQAVYESSTRDGHFTIWNIESSQTPRTSWVQDWKKNTLTQWIVPSAPEVVLSKFAKATLEYYPARDQTPIPMFVRRPPQCLTSDKPCPVIVHFHGGPLSQSKPSFSPEIQLWLDRGFIHVDPNVRGSKGYGKIWSNADNEEKRLNVITDIEDCAIFIKSQWKKSGVSPKIGVFGGSYGGYSTLMAMTYFAGAYDAGIASVAIGNLQTFLKNTAAYRRKLRASEYGDPDTDQEFLKKLSPVTYLDKVKGPIMIIHGVNDPRVPVGEAVQFHEALQARKFSSELLLFANEGHGISKRKNRAIELGHMIRFFEKFLF